MDAMVITYQVRLQQKRSGKWTVEMMRCTEGARDITTERWDEGTSKVVFNRTSFLEKLCHLVTDELVANQVDTD